MKLAGSNIVFRVDASLTIGTGHVVRSLTLADRLRGADARCHFVMRQGPGDLCDLVHSRGHDVIDFASAGRVDWNDDAVRTRAVLRTKPDLLVCDHYQIDARWEVQLLASCARLMIIDDLADRSHDCDLLLDQNPGRTPGDYSPHVPVRAVVLTGPVYSLLRPQFAAARAAALDPRECGSAGRLKILVSMGGADESNATLRIVRVMAEISEPTGLRLEVIVGTSSPWFEQIEVAARALPMPCVVHRKVEDMATLMAASDLAIGAAGGTALERCCLGLPSLVVVTAENQWPGARALDAAGAALLLGPCESIESVLPHALKRIRGSGELLDSMSTAAAALVDGLGADRVIQELERL